MIVSGLLLPEQGFKGIHPFQGEPTDFRLKMLRVLFSEANHFLQLLDRYVGQFLFQFLDMPPVTHGIPDFVETRPPERMSGIARPGKGITCVSGPMSRLVRSHLFVY